MNIKEIKTLQEILVFMKTNIKYGVDINNTVHIGNMENFRKLYKTASIDEIFKYGIGICIEQSS